MADSREERMQQRMRGAGRHEVADESFGLILPVEESPEASPEAPTPQPQPQPEPAPAPAPVSRSTPNTSAKRRRLASDVPRTDQQPRSTRSDSSRQSSSASKPDPYEVVPEPEPEPEPEREPEPEPVLESRSQPQHAPIPSRSSPPVAQPQSTAGQPKDAEPGISAPGSAQRRTSRGSASPRLSGGANMVEEVTESPANAPGSGHRRRVRDSGAVATQSTRLQKAVMMEDNELTGGVTTSSPLARKTRTSGSTAGSLSTRTARTADPSSLAEAAEVGDASSPSARPERNSPAPDSGSSQSSGSRRSTRSAVLGQPDELSSPVPLVESRRRARAKAKAQRPSAAADESEEVNELAESQPKPKTTRKVPPAVLLEVEDDTLEAPAKSGPKQTKKPAKAARKATAATKTQANPEAKRTKAPVQAPEEAEEDAAAPPKPKTKAARAAAATQEADGEEAEEASTREAALRIGKKRGRPTSARKPSPELDARASEDERPAKKRRERRPQESPAQQSQPKPPKNPSKSKATTKKTQSTGKAAKARRRHSSGEDIPITVHRYNKPRPRSADDPDMDVLQMEMPFANRNGVNVVDVLSQICDEIIESSVEDLLETAVHAETAAAKREHKTKIRAIKAFQEELHSRLLQHTTALDSMHALKKRVRAMQKEKVALRKEILGIRAEREQVALKMDAIRTQHEADSQEALHHLGLSSAMHDIELAIDQGRSAPEPNAKEQKLAELANLELLVSRVAEQACVGEGGGGTLKQIRDFNAFLERAATALETR